MPAQQEIVAGGMQAIENFSGLKEAQDARRWWKRLVLTLKHSENTDHHARSLIELFDVKLTHEAAQWADDTPEVMTIIEKEEPKVSDVEDLQKLFLARFRRTVPADDDVDRELGDLCYGA